MREFLTNYQLPYRPFTLFFALIWLCDQAPDWFIKMEMFKITFVYLIDMFNYIVDSDIQIRHPYLRHFALYISNSVSQFMPVMSVKVF